jgi:hypothetical protein
VGKAKVTKKLTVVEEGLTFNNLVIIVVQK